jgi:hypothetical protein
MKEEDDQIETQEEGGEEEVWENRSFPTGCVSKRRSVVTRRVESWALPTGTCGETRQLAFAVLPANHVNTADHTPQNAQGRRKNRRGFKKRQEK